ncbi:ferric reductase-like transmembrane domain-containing protein [Jannaschia donghaensis]|uniref:Ferric reductase like transmembrane component n=1 Tax=Jannaschia donghaensis TaxID=420998 RepID=A0A0M6YN56_9RHOB|nr:ferric reductase-like transmembrane domain-containing protein [Jannaschia donghaensis]CTQ51279.1 Ferric reductase like transmembrane component [Jannaschia donghaensis]
MLDLDTLRNPGLQDTGVVAIGDMNLAMILAIRARWLERCLDGLDKSYRLHRWLGVTAFAVPKIHWAMANGPCWLIDLGLRERAPLTVDRREAPPSRVKIATCIPVEALTVPRKLSRTSPPVLSARIGVGIAR